MANSVINRYQSEAGVVNEMMIITEEYSKTIPEDSRVFHIRQAHGGLGHVILKYKMWPRVFQLIGSGFTTEGNIKDRYIDPAQIIATPPDLLLAIKVGLFDYVLISYTDEKFWDEYSEIFDEAGPPEGHCLYTVGSEMLELVSCQYDNEQDD